MFGNIENITRGWWGNSWYNNIHIMQRATFGFPVKRGGGSIIVNVTLKLLIASLIIAHTVHRWIVL